MSESKSLYQSPGEWVAQELKGKRMEFCVAVYGDEYCQYVSLDDGVTPEQLLMAAEILRKAAMDLLCGDED